VGEGGGPKVGGRRHGFGG